MNKIDLINKAKELHQPTEDVYHEYLEKLNILVNNVNTLMLSREDITKLVGDGNIEMMKNNHANHVKFMSSMFYRYQPEVLIETILWVFRAYRSHGFQLTYWPAQLQAWLEVMRSTLTDKAFQQLLPFYNFMIVNQPYFTSLSDENLLNTYNHN